DDEESGGSGDDSSGSNSDEDNGSSLADGFFGFGAGHGAGTSTGGGSNGNAGAGSEGGENSGNPQMCNGGGSEPIDPQTPVESVLATPLGSNANASASLPTNSLPSLSVGNPIHVVTGNKYQHEVDIAPLPGPLGLSFSRHYNSELSNRAGVLGAGWRHSFEARVQVTRDDAPELKLIQADGREITFRRVGHGSYRAKRATDGELLLREREAACLNAEGCREYIWLWDSGRHLEFDSRGLLKKIREGALAVELQYDANDRLARVTDPQARTIQFMYDRKGRISRLKITGGASRRYRYDRRGNLIEVIASDRRARRYHYEDARHPHHLTGISAGMEQLASYGQAAYFERIATWAYDEEGRGVLSTHALNADKVTLQYGAGFTLVTDALGRVTRYVTDTKDGIALVREVRGPGCGVCGAGDVSYAYSDAFAVTSRHAKDQPTYRYEYDAERRLTHVYRNDALISRYDYKQGRMPSAVEYPSVNAEGHHRIEITRRADGLPESIRETGFAPKQNGFAKIERTYRLRYTESGDVSGIDGPREDANDITRFEYDDLRRLVAVVSPDGAKQRIVARDIAGRATRIRQTGRPDTEMAYDVEGRLTSMATRLHSGALLATQFRYDTRGRLHEIELPDHRLRQVKYDAADRITSERTFTGLVKKARYASDGEIAEQSLYHQGQLLKALYFSFDLKRRLIEVRDGDGPALQQLSYIDADAKPEQIVDALGRQTHLAYDSLGALGQIIAAGNSKTEFERDENERVTRITSPNGSQTAYEYDDFGRRVAETSPDRGTVSYRYDTADHLIEQMDARGKAIRFAYSAAGALADIQSEDGDSKLTYRNARLVSVVGPNDSQSFEYDQDGRTMQITRRIASHAYSTEFRYDEFGRLAKRRLFSGVWLEYLYGRDGALSEIRKEGLLNNRTVVRRADPKQTKPLSSLNDLRFGNELVVRTAIDNDARLTHRGTRGVAEQEYRYDEANRLRGIRAENGNANFGYDDADHLTSSDSQLGRLTYEYDHNGNRMYERRDNKATRYEYDARSNRLRSVDGDPVSYDTAGNVKAIGDRTYEYNSAGRPVRLFESGGLIARYTYNSLGERISKTDYSTSQPITTEYLFEQHRLVAEADDTGAITREYLYLDTLPVAVIDRGDVFWIHTDHLGAPIAVTDEHRRVVWRAQYEPFGMASVDADPDHDGHTFVLNLRRPGQYADRESGTYYNYYRDYDPALGRYLTSDPLGVAAGTNSYAYVHSNPMNRFDSLGLYDEMIHYYMTYFLALAAGIPQDIARTLAIAAQYVDENYLTQPIHGLASGNDAALPLYHFVLDSSGPNFGDSRSDLLTRFYNPQSHQLGLLRASTDPDMLQRLWLSLKQNEGACPMPQTIQNARYQLYGEYMHAYEDTFAHRDAYNMPYSVGSNLLNTPVAWAGHGGPDVPDRFGHAPDHSYNQNYRSRAACIVMINGEPSTTFNGTREQCNADGGTYYPVVDQDPTICEVLYVLGGREPFERLTQAQCIARGKQADALGSIFHPGTGDVWQYNELRTLRMEYELFNMLQTDFAEEIEGNSATESRRVPTWADLAGRPWSSVATENSRVGLSASYDDWRSEQGLSEVSTVLQAFNAATGTSKSRLAILNAWLHEKGFKDAQGEDLVIELWEGIDQLGAESRWSNIGWIPARSIPGVLVPRDEPCQPIRNIPGNCDDRPRR
ncbi:MAG TPA: DUF6765 family protein, partial [Steroidobacteraceae bacterium]|nr:DUF6765 family protein [Steroidobacteraceae bacterium]